VSPEEFQKSSDSNKSSGMKESGRDGKRNSLRCFPALQPKRKSWIQAQSMRTPKHKTERNIFRLLNLKLKLISGTRSKDYYARSVVPDQKEKSISAPFESGIDESARSFEVQSESSESDSKNQIQPMNGRKNSNIFHVGDFERLSQLGKAAAIELCTQLFMAELPLYLDAVLKYRQKCQTTPLKYHYDEYLDVVGRFIERDSVNEVNISGSMRRDILKYAQGQDSFQLLLTTPKAARQIFDRSYLEIEKIFWQNLNVSNKLLLRSFLFQ